ncbi:MAG: hypothetical protein AAGI03_00625 [Pseudomonadota bacterium]
MTGHGHNYERIDEDTAQQEAGAYERLAILLVACAIAGAILLGWGVLSVISAISEAIT